MLRSLSALQKLKIQATDGDVGTVKDSYFDDARWTVRYLVVDTGRWLPGREVLISPQSVRDILWEREALDVSISRDQVKASPSIDFDKPVSRQHEAAFLDYYGYPYYWGGGGMLGGISASPAVPRPPANEARETQRMRGEGFDPHLRSTKHVTGYHIEASDGKIGHIDDFLFDDQNWSLRFFVVDTRNWLPGRHVLVATDWIDDLDWDRRVLRVALSQEAIRESPEWHDDELLGADAERSLYRHYGRPPAGGTDQTARR